MTSQNIILLLLKDMHKNKENIRKNVLSLLNIRNYNDNLIFYRLHKTVALSILF